MKSSMNIKYIIAKAMKISGLNRLLFSIRKPFLMHKALKSQNIKEAAELLEKYHPNNGRTCFCNRTFLKDEYDCCIIIPAYNAETTIVKCLNSVLNQKTNFSYHIICVNDGSDDNTPTILNSFADKVTVITQNNSGLSNARNSGINFNRAKYIMFVDSDDLLTENALDNLLKCAFEHDADIVEGSCLIFNHKGKKAGELKHTNKNIENFYELFGFAWMKVFKRDLFEKVQFPENYYFEDSLMKLIIYPIAKKIYTIDNNVYLYIKNKNSITHTSITKPKCVDALYCLLSLHYEREKYGLCCNYNYYEYMLETAKLMYLRTMYCKEDIKIAIFLIYSDFICGQFKGFKSKNNIDLENAFRNRNYKLYKTTCEL